MAQLHYHCAACESIHLVQRCMSHLMNSNVCLFLLHMCSNRSSQKFFVIESGNDKVKMQYGLNL